MATRPLPVQNLDTFPHFSLRHSWDQHTRRHLRPPIGTRRLLLSRCASSIVRRVSKACTFLLFGQGQLPWVRRYTLKVNARQNASVTLCDAVCPHRKPKNEDQKRLTSADD
jgi:hypothetical protein